MITHKVIIGGMFLVNDEFGAPNPVFGFVMCWNLGNGLLIHVPFFKGLNDGTRE